MDERDDKLELLVDDDTAVQLLAAAIAEAAVAEFRRRRQSPNANGDESPAKASSPFKGIKDEHFYHDRG